MFFLTCVLGLERGINDNLKGDISIQHMDVQWKDDDKKKKSS